MSELAAEYDRNPPEHRIPDAPWQRYYRGNSDRPFRIHMTSACPTLAKGSRILWVLSGVSRDELPPSIALTLCTYCADGGDAAISPIPDDLDPSSTKPFTAEVRNKFVRAVGRHVLQEQRSAARLARSRRKKEDTP